VGALDRYTVPPSVHRQADARFADAGPKPLEAAGRNGGAGAVIRGFLA
jgi:hypothetical protein